MKAIGYIRVSTEDQAAHGISLDAQRAKIEAYALTKDLELVGIIEDAGKSAKDLRRPGVQEVLKKARRKEIDAVIIVKLDRMFRCTVDALNTAQDFDRRGVALHSIHESLDTQSAMGKFFFTLTAALAEMERGLIGERTRAALARKKERGEKTGGHVPYGYDLSNVSSMAKKDTSLMENSQEQGIIARMKRQRKQGLSFKRVADTLNADGIPTKRGCTWTAMQVSRVIQAV
jgi:DNA invertase Pin-like site-specific DNA recombinase